MTDWPRVQERPGEGTALSYQLVTYGGMTAGRVETALEKGLLERRDILPAERGALRSQARAIDVAEKAGDARTVTEANRVYLDLRRAAGLIAGNKPAEDTFAALLADLERPSTPGSHPADS